MLYCIDFPVKRKFDKPGASIVGWITDEESCQEVSFRIGDKPIPHSSVDRPDVRGTYHGQQVLGFSILLDFVREVPATGAVMLKAVRRSEVLMSASFTVERELRMLCAQFGKVRTANRQWCLEHLRCPRCGSAKLRTDENLIVCDRCQTLFPQHTGALNFLTPQLYERCSLKHADNISSHGYDPQALEMIEEVTGRGGKIL